MGFSGHESVARSNLLLILLTIAMSGTPVVENPAGSLIWLHDRLEWLLERLEQSGLTVARQQLDNTSNGMSCVWGPDVQAEVLDVLLRLPLPEAHDLVVHQQCNCCFQGLRHNEKEGLQV